MKTTYSITGMHCASCSTLIQGEMQEISGITSCDINLINHTATLDFADQPLPLDTLNKKIQPLGYSFTTLTQGENVVQGGKPDHATASEKKEFITAKREMWISLPLIAFSLFLMARMLSADYGFLGIQMMPEGFHYVITRRVMPLIATFVILTIGRKYLKAVRIYLTRGKATMDTLVGIGTGFAYLYSIIITLFGSAFSDFIDPERVFYEAVIVVIGFISIGKYMEQRTMSKTGQAIKALLNLQVKNARVLVPVDKERKKAE